MPEAKKNQGNAAAWWMLIVCIAGIVTWIVISPELLMKTLRAERSSVVQMAGPQADQWVYTKMLSATTDPVSDMTKSLNDTKDMPAALKKWMQGRIIVTWLWGSIILYRIHLLSMFWFVMMPFTIVIALDGFWVRTIRTFQFSSQSPIRHRMGVMLSLLTMFLATIWVAIPLPMPAIAAPIAIALVGWAMWMWLSNLQKRI